MNTSFLPSRVFFLDLLRALAVILMVQSHTLDVLLTPEYRSLDYPLFKVWLFVCGMTAPLFLLTAGTVFMYLLRSSATPFRHNPRVGKGVRSALLLFAVGYLLRLPSGSPIGLFFVPTEAWREFWVVDVLQLIGVGLLLLLGGAALCEKFKLNERVVFSVVGLLFFLAAPFCGQVNWNARLLAPLAAYLYSGSGSYFPLFPWAGYVLCGGALGAALAQFVKTQPLPEAISRWSLRLALAGIAWLVMYFCCDWFNTPLAKVR